MPTGNTMNIAIIGAGNVGSSLAKGWIAAGHNVRFAVRDPNSPKLADVLSSLGPAASAQPPQDAVKDAAVVVVATPWDSTRAAIESCGSLAGKIVVDCTNPLRPGLSGLEVGHETSGGEQVAGWATGASVFKCFNQTGAENMAGQFGYSHRLVMFIAGDDAARKPTVMQLASEAGFEAVDAGPLSAARFLEPLAMLWIHLAFKMGQGRRFGFALVRR
jgi:predicted dinucleotide-binding enzyme